MKTRHVPRWIKRRFRRADLGDRRRSARFQQLLAGASAVRGETIATTFRSPRERQGAYDFVEHDTIEPQRVIDAVADATAREVADLDEVLIALDGSSLTLVDEDQVKGFGSIGTKTAGGRGIKVMTNLVLRLDGTPIGCGPFTYWCRADERVDKKKYRKLTERESHYWHQSVDATVRSFARCAPNTKLHFIGDAEADASAFLQKLSGEGHEFTIRGRQASRVMNANGRRINMLKRVRRSTPIGIYDIEVPASKTQGARRATLEVRTSRVELVLRDHHLHKRDAVAITVVWAREVGRSRNPLNWVLYTSKAVRTAAEAAAVLRSYTYRWRIEDLHRTWKRGGCHVEKNQLRSANAVIKWASVTAVIAARAEHLKHRARTSPDEPASSELTPDELDALRMAKKNQKARTEKLVDGVPSLSIAVRWIADIGGYVGNRSSGQPGATTIGRGLEVLEIFRQALLVVRAEEREKRQ